MNKGIKRFGDFIKESQEHIRKFALDTRFEWTEDISNLIEEVFNKIDYLKYEYNYERHESSDGFEFDIKARNWPDAEELSKKYGLSEDEIYGDWDLFLEDNLRAFGDDIIHDSGYFTDWSQTGRSGGWLVLKYESYAFDSPEERIDEIISDLNYKTEEITDEELEKWKKFKEEAGGGLRLLKRLDIKNEEFENVEEAEEESKNVESELKNYIGELKGLEADLIKVENGISDFWKNAEDYFESHIKSNLENR